MIPDQVVLNFHRMSELTVSFWDYIACRRGVGRRVSLDTPGSQDITELLAAWGGGNQDAFERLVPLVYAELKRIARRHMFRESEGHILQTTALVHEAYMKLVSSPGVKWQDRAHFFAVSSQQMRRILGMRRVAPAGKARRRSPDSSAGRCSRAVLFPG